MTELPRKTKEDVLDDPDDGPGELNKWLRNLSDKESSASCVPDSDELEESGTKVKQESKYKYVNTDGSKMIGDYKISRRIMGKGTFGEVR
mmetsp:Transcript_25053/g.38887  ORF Transcript_25053/g.38887 Transcript_25053/m.38887 type:complete len:90 (+) Transcript_25053:223-492(+)